MQQILIGGGELLRLAESVLQSSAQIRFSARGNSMRPRIYDGDILLIKPIRDSYITLGDILLIDNNNQAVIHRVIRIIEADNPRRYFLKGDSLDRADGWYTDKQIIGRVVIIERGVKTIDLTISSQVRKAHLWAVISALMNDHLWIPMCLRKFLYKILAIFLLRN